MHHSHGVNGSQVLNAKGSTAFNAIRVIPNNTESAATVHAQNDADLESERVKAPSSTDKYTNHILTNFSVKKKQYEPVRTNYSSMSNHSPVAKQFMSIITTEGSMELSQPQTHVASPDFSSTINVQISSAPPEPSKFATIQLNAEHLDPDQQLAPPMINGVTVKPILGGKRTEFKVNLHRAEVQAMNTTLDSIRNDVWQTDPHKDSQLIIEASKDSNQEQVTAEHLIQLMRQASEDKREESGFNPVFMHAKPSSPYDYA